VNDHGLSAMKSGYGVYHRKTFAKIDHRIGACSILASRERILQNILSSSRI